MKSFEVKALGLEELSLEETYTIEGGAIPWGTVIKAVAKFVVETVAAWGISKCCDEAAKTDDSTEEVEVEYVYDGGELEAAVCEG